MKLRYIQTMEQIESFKCSMIHEGLVVNRDRIQSEYMLIHEHDFVTRAKGANHSALCCITCGDSYCDICGKLL
jgi:hypothetical protein